MREAVSIQRSYYRETAGQYDVLHGTRRDEHELAMAFMLSAIDFLGITSILDIGSGTGRALLYIKDRRPDIRIVGIEPSPELRELGHQKGLASSELVDGDAESLAFPEGAFDLVCEFAALHHISNPDKAVAEMLRVAGKAVFISDCNNFGQGRPLVRSVKQALRAMGLWHAVDLLKTRGKGYTISPGDGLAYSYSVFDNYAAIAKGCHGGVHLMYTVPSGSNIFRSASHVAVLGIK